MNTKKPEPWAVCWDGEAIDTFDCEATARRAVERALDCEAKGVAFPVCAIEKATAALRHAAALADEMSREAHTKESADAWDYAASRYREALAALGGAK